jgi:hypothetical protein
MSFPLEPVATIAAELDRIRTRKDSDRPGNKWEISVENIWEDESTSRESTAISVSWCTVGVLIRLEGT